jgi:hypothetical protein
MLSSIGFGQASVDKSAVEALSHAVEPFANGQLFPTFLPSAGRDWSVVGIGMRVTKASLASSLYIRP